MQWPNWLEMPISQEGMCFLEFYDAIQACCRLDGIEIVSFLYRCRIISWFIYSPFKLINSSTDISKWGDDYIPYLSSIYDGVGRTGIQHRALSNFHEPRNMFPRLSCECQMVIHCNQRMEKRGQILTCPLTLEFRKQQVLILNCFHFNHQEHFLIRAKTLPQYTHHQ